MARGGSVVDPEVVSTAALRHPGRWGDDRRSTISRRGSCDVLVEMAQRQQQRGDRKGSLTLSLRAVEKYVGSIFRKLDLPGEEAVSRRVAAVLLYFEESRYP